MASCFAETGEGFEVTTALGAVFLPDEAATTSAALQIADQRLYAEKRQSIARYAAVRRSFSFRPSSSGSPTCMRTPRRSQS